MIVAFLHYKSFSRKFLYCVICFIPQLFFYLLFVYMFLLAGSSAGLKLPNTPQWVLLWKRYTTSSANLSLFQDFNFQVCLFVTTYPWVTHVVTSQIVITLGWDLYLAHYQFEATSHLVTYFSNCNIHVTSCLNFLVKKAKLLPWSLLRGEPRFQIRAKLV